MKRFFSLFVFYFLLMSGLDLFAEDSGNGDKKSRSVDDVLRMAERETKALENRAKKRIDSLKNAKKDFKALIFDYNFRKKIEESEHKKLTQFLLYQEVNYNNANYYHKKKIIDIEIDHKYETKNLKKLLKELKEQVKSIKSGHKENLEEKNETIKEKDLEICNLRKLKTPTFFDFVDSNKGEAISVVLGAALIGAIVHYMFQGSKGGNTKISKSEISRIFEEFRKLQLLLENAKKT